MMEALLFVVTFFFFLLFNTFVLTLALAAVGIKIVDTKKDLQEQLNGLIRRLKNEKVFTTHQFERLDQAKSKKIVMKTID